MENVHIISTNKQETVEKEASIRIYGNKLEEGKSRSDEEI